MAIYLITVFSSVGCAFLASFVSRRKNLSIRPQGHRRLQDFLSNYGWLFLFLATLSMLIPALVSGFRYDVGTDYFYTYRRLYDDLLAFIQSGWRLTDPPPVEPGIWYLLYFIQAFGGGYLSFFIISSFFICTFFWLAFFQNSEIPWYSVLLFFLAEAYFVSMNAVKQYMALGLLVFALRYIKKPCFWKYLLCVLAASLFHYTAIIFLPLYVFIYFKFNPLFAVGATVLLSLLNTPLQALLTFLISKTQYAWYLESDYFQANRFYSGKFVIHLLLLAIAIIYWFIKPQNRQLPIYRFLLFCQLVLVFLLMNRNLIPAADRIVWYLEGFHLFLVPLVAWQEENRYLRWAILAIPALLWMHLCYNEIFVYGWHEVIPYQTIITQPNLGEIF